MSTSKGTVLITGASSGIGATYADRFAARGHDLIVVARNNEHLAALATRLGATHGVRVEALAADLTDRAGLTMVEKRLTTDESITHLVNNAGFGAVSPLVASHVDEMERMVAVNVVAPMRLAYAAVPRFLARGKGTLINISSIVAIGPEILNGVYGATKSFVLALSHSLRKELEGTGVHVQVVLPGATGTAFWNVAGLPVRSLPKEWVMPVTDLVDAALAGLDLGEYATIPSLQDIGEWEAWEAARQIMLPHLSSAEFADRYRPSATA